MKTRLWLSLALLLLISLTACQSATPTVAPVVAPTQLAQPATNTGDEGAYPAPTAEPASVAPGSASVLYPDPQSGDEVQWSQVAAMILNGEVIKITRDNDLQATIDLKDGRSLILRGPTDKKIQQLLETCGDPCKSIQMAP